MSRRSTVAVVASIISFIVGPVLVGTIAAGSDVGVAITAVAGTPLSAAAQWPVVDWSPQRTAHPHPVRVQHRLTAARRPDRGSCSATRRRGVGQIDVSNGA